MPAQKRIRFRWSAFALLAAVGCSSPPSDSADDASSPPDGLPDETVLPDAVDEWSGAEDIDDGASDCSLCNTPCEGTEVSCGTWCCIGTTMFLPDGGDVTLSCAGPTCNWGLFYAGLLVVDFERYPGLETDSRFPMLSEYVFRGDGTELLVGAEMVEGGAHYGCINRCYPGRSHFWVVDIASRQLLYTETDVPDHLWPAVMAFSELADEVSGGWPCPSPLTSTEGVACRDVAVVPDRDETFWVGNHGGEYVIYGYDRWAHEMVDRRDSFPWLPHALFIYRTSEVGRFLDWVDLRLVEVGDSVWKAGDTP